MARTVGSLRRDRVGRGEADRRGAGRAEARDRCWGFFFFFGPKGSVRMTPTAMSTNSQSTARYAILINMRVKLDIELLFSPCRASAGWRSSAPPPCLPHLQVGESSRSLLAPARDADIVPDRSGLRGDYLPGRISDSGTPTGLTRASTCQMLLRRGWLCASSEHDGRSPGQDGQSCRNVMVVRPRLTRLPSTRRAWLTCCPLTKVPLVEPLSTRMASSLSRRILTWCLETPLSTRRRSQSVPRPSSVTGVVSSKDCCIPWLAILPSAVAPPGEISNRGRPAC